MKSIISQYFRKKNVPGLTPPVARIDELRLSLPDASEWQRQVICDVEPATMTSPERILALCEATQYIVRNEIEGAIVECGVWRGGSMASVAMTLRHHQANDRQLWMYDTYEGMTAPTRADVDYLGRSACELMNAESRQLVDRDNPVSIWCRSPLEGVKNTMAATGYDVENIQFIKGMVEQTLPLITPDKIALLRLDTDWYESTRCELEFLFPKLVPGGVLIVDDYGHWAGCRRAVDEYFEENQINMLLNRIDYTGRIGIHSPAPKPNLRFNDREVIA